MNKRQMTVSPLATVNKRALTPAEVEDRYAIKKQTLANWRCQKKGPPYILLDRKVLYLINDIDEFILQHRVITSR